MLRSLQPEHGHLVDDRRQKQLNGERDVWVRAVAPFEVLQAAGLDQLGQVIELLASLKRLGSRQQAGPVARPQQQGGVTDRVCGLRQQRGWFADRPANRLPERR